MGLCMFAKYTCIYTISVCIYIYIFHIHMKYKKAALMVSNAKSADTKHRT